MNLTASGAGAGARRSGAAEVWPSTVELHAELREQNEPSDGNGAHRLSTRVECISPGAFEMEEITGAGEGWLGVLVLDGLITLELNGGRGRVAWLIGAEDLIRPWEMGEICLTQTRTWRVLSSARLALLDRSFARRAIGIPVITQSLLARTARTSHWLLAQSLLISSPLVEERLLLLFALMGERWGKVTADGVLLELPLTHNLLAAMCGARRPTVTIALSSLQTDGLLAYRRDRGWLLRRRPATDADSHPSWQRYASALGLVY